MNLRDENVLREMNLYPLWVRKNGPAQIDQPSVEVPQVIEAQPVVNIAPVEAVRNVETNIEPAAGWSELKAQVKDCTACKLRAGCTQTVFGVGDEHADWLFVGEGPGADEDERGEPFVGQAGKLLDNMLASIKLKRGDNVYIANIVKCRPPENRTPNAEEVATCLPYLKQQIALIKPKLIVALGKTAATSLLGKDATLGSLRGALHDFDGTPLLVTYHPAYLLRSPAEKAKAWQDLCMAVKQVQ
ncbi:MAG: DNA polymerase bacteriophage-type [Gallionellaceae bacterium]|nr:MAG: DNA polymerase bacteriophage-type [Gallionellaceae bacterium]